MPTPMIVTLPVTVHTVLDGPVVAKENAFNPHEDDATSVIGWFTSNHFCGVGENSTTCVPCSTSWVSAAILR